MGLIPGRCLRLLGHDASSPALLRGAVAKEVVALMRIVCSSIQLLTNSSILGRALQAINESQQKIAMKVAADSYESGEHKVSGVPFPSIRKQMLGVNPVG